MENDINVPVTDEDNVIPLFPDIPEAEHPAGIEMTEWAFTNDKANPHIRHLFHMFYDSVFKNKMGVMHARLRDTDEVHTLIVGVEVTDEGVLTWPLAKILTEEEQGKYQAPNGEGGFA